MNTTIQPTLSLAREPVRPTATAGPGAHASGRRMNVWIYLTFLTGFGAAAFVSSILAAQPRTDEAAAFVPIFLLPTIVTGFVFVSRMWGSLSDHGGRMGGASSWLLLFVPLFNLYWIFQVFPGFATDFNRAAENAGIRSRVSFGLMVTYVLLSWVPVVGLLLFSVVIWQVCRGVTALHATPAPAVAAQEPAAGGAASSGSRRRSRRSFESFAGWHSVADQWAAKQGYRPVEDRPGWRTYRKGTGFLVAPMVAAVAERDHQLVVEGWIAPGFFARLASLFLLPAEMGLQSGGFRGVLPRRLGRTAVNELLRDLRGPAIT